MAFKTCMNILCGTTSSAEWKTGWRLRSGELANLCDKCGYAFERRVYCEEFHADDSGWRQCVTCGKRVHCGCIASWSLIELLDGGGVKCIGCARNPGPKSSSNDGKWDGAGAFCLIENNFVSKQLGKYEASNGSHLSSILKNADTNATFGLLKQEGPLLPLGEVASTLVSNLSQSPVGLFQKARLDMPPVHMQAKDHYETVVHPNLNITLGVATGNLHSVPGAFVDEREQRNIPNAFQQGLVSQHLFPRTQLGFSTASDTSLSTVPSIRVARPPVDGRGRHQLLPRYWPRITDQELQQISGDSNCTIVPLFEKVLSASDAGRIGRLVLPKACAEAYFPHISQPEGLPIKIQDVKGKEWVFQFRFWPNNNSRMYVLEGVTPCIQSMQLQAGDTVTFSRMDPEGKLVMGFRKASNSISMQCVKGSTEPHMNALSKPLDSISGNVKWHGSDKYGEPTEEGMLPGSTLVLERKKSRNIGSKNKRLLIDSQDALALKLTWEEVQGMLRPPQSARPSIFVVEDYEFEEYEEPPVFGKSTVFTARPSGVLEQWAQCDSCSKWRRLPADILLPPRWTCADNVWDQSRCFCSAPDELGPRELESLLQLSKDSKKRRMAMASRMMQDQESSGLDALANAATLGDNTGDPSSSGVAATTKHPRHRPGCSCIVCIQPPSGKGKHKSTCTCTVCMTVKRRFKTLMMRKKKRQSEQEAELALRNPQSHDNKTSKEKPDDAENIIRSHLDHIRQNEGSPQVGPSQDNPDSLGENPNGGLIDTGKGLDLNCRPEREEELRAGPGEVSQLRDLLQLASIPLEDYMKQNENGLTSSEAEQRGGSGSLQGDPVGEIGEHVEDHSGAQAVEGQVNPGDGSSSGADSKPQTDPL